MKQIDVPEDDVDPTEQEEEEDKAAEVMLENMSRQELIRRRREMDAKEKDRARRRQDWKDSRQHRLQQGRALNVRDIQLIFCFWKAFFCWGRGEYIFILLSILLPPSYSDDVILCR